MGMTKETKMQMAVVKYCRGRARNDERYAWIYHPRNENSKNARQGALYKAMGVTAGVSDIVIPVPVGKFHGAYMELKVGMGRLQPSQKSFLEFVAGRGYYAVVCRSYRAAVDEIDRYMDGEAE